MKKIYGILILAGLFIGSQVLANVVTTTRKIKRNEEMRHLGQV